MCIRDSPNIYTWLKKLFPGFTENEYKMLRYAGTEESPIFRDSLNVPEQENIRKFFKIEKIVIDGKVK